LFVPHLHGGGAERVMLELARGFAEQGHDTELVLCRRLGDLADQVPSSVKVVELHTPNARASVWPLARYLTSHRPDALLAAMTHANLAALLASRLARVASRIVVAEHNAVGERMKGARSAKVGWLFRAAGASYRRWADAVVCVSEGVADDVASHLGLRRDELHVIYNPIVTDRVLRAAAEPLEDVAAGADAPLLAVGRLSPQKGFDLLLEAFARLREKRPVRLVILGEGSERAALEEQAHRLGIRDHLELPGFVQNPHAWMARAGAVVLSSRWEGLPTVVVEALAAGAPIAAFDCPFGPREILGSGRWGHLAPAGDVAALAEAIGRALDEGRTPENVRARQSRAADFTPESSVRRYLEILLEPRAQRRA
jgi:glycosyltransferase involved in cell wall biosynthesis